MKTQISRDTFDDAKRFSGVYLQQGRMVVDADVNELGDIAKRRLEAALADVVASGAPRTGALAIVKSGTTLQVQPGRLYVDGVPARLDAAAPLALAAQPDYRNAPALPANNLRLYADVWERTVCAFEDASLQDPGLHGADTATRTRTMLQVKWCAAGIDPGDPAVNPRGGDARLTLKLRSISTGSDPCDPCAAEVSVDERIGNYLFRVEVHDVFDSGGQAHVVLKWSRDNGAEAYPFDAYPAGFDQGDWVWEYFDGDSENLLGHHFPAGQPRRRGVLQETFTRPVSPLPNAFVRQWDGYAEFNLTTGALVAGKGRDRGVPLSTTLAATAHAFVQFDAGAGTALVNLELLELQLAYKTGSALKRFVAGDYWQVPVREAVDKSGDTVLGAGTGALPRGIVHHYLLLADVDAAGNLVAFGDAKRRQMAFPPLTDVRAQDVGFSDHCAGLYGGAQNVQQALDALCSLGAEDIGYTLPGCGTAAAPSVASLMKAGVPNFPDLDGQPKSPSVKDILDALMCHLNASRLPYDPAGQSARWSDIDEGAAAPLTVQQAIDHLAANLEAGDIRADVVACTGSGGSKTMRELMSLAAGPQTVAGLLGKLFCDLRATHLPLDRSQIQCPAIATDASVVSVQDAIDKLCHAQGQGCEITVAVGELERVLRDFLASAVADIALCLLPGVHVISDDLVVDRKRGISVQGSASAAVVIEFRGRNNALAGQEVALQGLSVRIPDGGQLRLGGDRISSTRCSYQRSGSGAIKRPMLLLHPGAGASQLAWRDNVLVDTWSQSSGLGAFQPDVVANVQLTRALKTLTDSPDIFMDSVAFDDAVGEVADALIAMPAADRRRWADTIAAGAATTTGGAAAAPAAPTGGGASPGPRILARDAIGAGETRMAILPRLVDTSGTSNLADTARFTDTIKLAAPERSAVVEAIGDGLVAILFLFGVNIALGIASHRSGGVLQGNVINGEVVLMNELALDAGEGMGMDAGVAITSVAKDRPLVGTGGGVLTLEGNRIDRLWTLVSATASTQLTGPVSGLAACTLIGNDFIGSRHSVLAARLSVQGNHFEIQPANAPAPLGRLLANQVAVTGNVSSDGVPPMLVGTNAFRSNSNFFTVALF